MEMILSKDQIEDIQSKIDYVFKNIALLNQAFTRRSYSAEHTGALDNELLEHIGDSFLGNIVTGILVKSFTSVGPNGFESKKNEKDFTDMKKYLVCSERLFEKIDSLHLSKHLIMGKGDINKDVHTERKVKEDLFEAIIGAIAIDTNFDMFILEKVIQRMMKLDYYIQNDFEDMRKNQKITSIVDLVGEPIIDSSINQLQEVFQKGYINKPVYTEVDLFIKGIYCWKVTCSVDGFDKVFEGVDGLKKEAKKIASLKTLEYLSTISFDI